MLDWLRVVLEAKEEFRIVMAPSAAECHLDIVDL